MLKKLLLASAVGVGFSMPASAETINILMETVPDTEYVKELLPEFKAATGIDVEIGPPAEVAAGALRLRSHRGLRECSWIKHLATDPQLRARARYSSAR